MPRLKFPLLILFFNFSFTIFALPIGKVTLIKGEAHSQRNGTLVELSKGAQIEDKDLIKTSEKSLVKVLFSDKTSVVIGPNSQFQIENYSIKKRTNVFKLIKGKFRAKIEKKVEAGESIDFKTKLAGLGVRGTEFLTNSYMVQGKSVTDTALLEGNLATSIEGAKPFQLKAGQAFNTNALSLGKGVSKLSPELVKKLLANSDYLLPNLQNLDGTFNNISELIDKSLSKLSAPSIAPLAIGTTVAASTVIPKKIASLKKEKRKKRKKKIDLTKEPWDIRDALQRKKKLRAKNECFYWFYKSIPGGGEEERFRRERDCDEFDYDL